jgi:hypothetical protein
MTTFEHGDCVNILSNGSRIKGRVESYDQAADSYQVRTPSGAVWRVDGLWLKPRAVRNPASF